MATPGQRPAAAIPGPLTRVIRAWRELAAEQRRAAVAALALWVTMFLPWYSQHGLSLKGQVTAGGITLTAWDAFSWVEAFVLLVVIGVLALLFARGERRAPRLPGGDALAISLGGGFATVLIVYGMLERQGTQTVSGAGAITTGIDWGIFFALFAAIWLAWSGRTMRSAGSGPSPLLEARLRPRPSSRPAASAHAARAGTATPPPPSRSEPPAPLAALPAGERPQQEHRGVTRADAEQLSFELPGGGERSFELPDER